AQQLPAAVEHRARETNRAIRCQAGLVVSFSKRVPLPTVVVARTLLSAAPRLIGALVAAKGPVPIFTVLAADPRAPGQNPSPHNSAPAAHRRHTSRPPSQCSATSRRTAPTPDRPEHKRDRV